MGRGVVGRGSWGVEGISQGIEGEVLRQVDRSKIDRQASRQTDRLTGREEGPKKTVGRVSWKEGDRQRLAVIMVLPY